jgi:hypothetical protein
MNAQPSPRGREADELTRLAFVYAEQDRKSFLEAIRNANMPDEVKETKALIRELRSYRL